MSLLLVKVQLYRECVFVKIYQTINLKSVHFILSNYPLKKKKKALSKPRISLSHLISRL